MSPPLPDPIESELVRLLDGPDDDFWPGVARLCQQHPERSKDIQREAERLQARAEGTRPTGSTQAKPTIPADDADLKAGDRVGAFTVLDEIGHGGMGSVYLAEQKEPVRRRVALKVIKLGMDTKAVLARFEAERQALAMMDHSHIAKVLEAGVTPKGRPYFAMEYVKGVPLTRYCDENKLSLEERLLLFKQVCSGVQHAHTKGVIHRDLTPNNVLVTLQDGKPAAKIIDFGLARATDQKLTEKTLFTEQGVILGTPEYMSPEQAGLSALDIDMRSDVYTLGVLLYELLTGKLPFEGATLRAGGYDAMCKTIREVDPPRPSTKVTTHQGGTDGAAKLRRTDASTLLKRLRGDLDWIVLKCLEKDRTRRYETVSALADDVERHLASEPVLARAPSAAYRLAKFARRYRVQFVAATSVALAMVAAVVVSVVFMLRAQDSEARAVESAREAKQQKDVAQEQTRVAETARAGEARKAKEAAESAAAARRSAEEATRNAQEALNRKREFDQLAGVVQLDRLQKALDDLATPWRDLAPARRWLADADRILALRPELANTLADLREQALPATPEEIERDRATHPRRTEWQTLKARLTELEQAQALRADSSVVLPSLTPEELAMTPAQLNWLAWRLVDPLEHAGKQPHAPRALALAKHAWTKIEAAGATDCDLADTLAWALFWNGRDEEAVRQSEVAQALAPEEQKEEFGRLLADLRARIAAGEGKAAVRAQAESVAIEVAGLRNRVHDLEVLIGERRTYRFESEAQGFLHDVLSGLLVKLDAFAKAERPEVEARVRCAELTTGHPKARATWQHAKEAIAKADDAGASALYRAHPIALRPQLGLVPIGMNPVTKLWEFYELRSAWDRATVPDPAALRIPVHDAEGRISVDDGTGIVFVLVPGGTFTMGAQKTDKGAPTYDPETEEDEMPHQVTLAPFFLARHELTQGQWRRLGGSGDQRLLEIGNTYPIADVDWFSSDALLRSRGLTLPTEAQWEYGCRATTTTPWWTGADAASLGDELETIRRVGSGRSNPFGLFDVHGNVWEWCADRWGDYTHPWREGDGLRLVDVGSSSFRALRRGGFGFGPWSARSSRRSGYAPTDRSDCFGVRAARILQP